MLAVLELNNGFLELKSGVGEALLGPSPPFLSSSRLKKEGLLGLKSGVGDPSRAFSTVLELKKAQEGVLGPSPPFLSSRRLKKRAFGAQVGCRGLSAFSTVLAVLELNNGFLELKNGEHGGEGRESPTPDLSSKSPS